MKSSEVVYGKFLDWMESVVIGTPYNLHIELDQERGLTEALPVTAGNYLQGRVVVELKKPTKLQSSKLLLLQQQNENVGLHLLTIRLYGKEKVYMSQRHARRQATSTSTLAQIPKTAERQFFNVALPLQAFPKKAYNIKTNTLNAGIYKFPFQIQLPLVLPSTSSFNPLTRTTHHDSSQHNMSTTTTTTTTNNNNFSLPKRKPGFRIQYKLYVSFHSVKRSMHKGVPVQTKPLPIWVSCAPKSTIHQEPLPCMVPPTSHDIQGSPGFFSSKAGGGAFLTAASLEDTVVGRSNDKLHIHVACRNNSRSTIQRVQIQLLEELRWGTIASTTTTTTTTTVSNVAAAFQQSATIPLFTLQNLELPSLAKEGKTFFQTFTQSLLGTKNRQERNLLQSIHQDLKSDSSKIILEIPTESFARNSYSGQLVHVSHLIEIQFLTTGNNRRGVNLNNNPTIRIPIRIVGGGPNCLYSLPAIDLTSINDLMENESQSVAHPEESPNHVIESGTTNQDATPSHPNNPQKIPEKLPDAPMDPDIEVTYSQTAFPMASATPIFDHNNIDDYPIPMAVASVDDHDVTVLGGDAILFCVNDDNDPQNTNGQGTITPLSDLIPLAPPSQVADDNATTIKPKNSASLHVLLSEMRSSIDDYNIIQKKIQNPEWIELFRSLSPDEFGMIIKHVNIEFDQPRVAALMGPYLNQNKGVTCEYVAAAIRNTSEWHRATTAQRLLHMCVDASSSSENANLVLAELSEWDQTVAGAELQTAMVG